MEEFFKNRNVLKNVLILLLFVVVSLVIYYPTLHSEPLWDDWVFIFKSWTIRNISPWQFWVLGDHRRSWPMFFTVLVMMYKAWGMKVFYYHLTSVLLHSVNGFLIYKVLKKLGGSNTLLIALLYLVHPLNFFTVSWIIQIKTLLCIFFFLISFIFFLNDQEKKSQIHYWISVITFGLSVLSKSAFAPILILMLFFKNKQKIIPYFLICLYAVVLTVWTTHLKDQVKGIKVSSLIISDSVAEENVSMKNNFIPRKMGPLLKRDKDPFGGIALSIKNLGKYSLYLIYPWDNLLIQPRTEIDYDYKELIGAITIVSLSIFFLFKLIEYGDTIALSGYVFFLLSLIPLCGMFFIPIFYYSNFVEYWLSVPFIGLCVCLSRFKFNDKVRRSIGVLVIVLSFRTLYVSIQMPEPIKMIRKSMDISKENVLIDLILAKHYYFKKDYMNSNEILLRVRENKTIDRVKIDNDLNENFKLMKESRSEIFTL